MAFPHFISIVGLDAIIGINSSVSDGLYKGLFVGIFWVATSIGVTYLFSQRPVRLMLIDAGYYIMFFAIAGLILGVW